MLKAVRKLFPPPKLEKNLTLSNENLHTNSLSQFFYSSFFWPKCSIQFQNASVELIMMKHIQSANY